METAKEVTNERSGKEDDKSVVGGVHRDGCVSAVTVQKRISNFTTVKEH